MFLFQFVIDIESRTSSISPINDLGLFVSRIISIALTIGAILFMLYFVMGAIKWLTAGGDKGKVEEARTAIINACIGLAVLAASWAVFLLVGYFLGLNLVNQPGNPGGGSGGNSGPLAACVCGGAGGCAENGDVGPLALNGSCFLCTPNGWIDQNNTNCGPITCQSCP